MRYLHVQINMCYLLTPMLRYCAHYFGFSFNPWSDYYPQYKGWFLNRCIMWVHMKVQFFFHLTISSFLSKIVQTVVNGFIMACVLTQLFLLHCCPLLSESALVQLLKKLIPVWMCFSIFPQFSHIGQSLTIANLGLLCSWVSLCISIVNSFPN